MNSVTAAAIAIVPVAAVAVLGGTATKPNIDGWYAHLAKPSFNPPNWVFAPVWTLLYAAMSFAIYRILISTDHDWLPVAIALFALQLALNAAWSWVFFAGQSPRGGLAVIAALWLGIASTVLAFWQIDGLASVLLWPYLAWVSFAAILNLQIARLNPEEG